MIERVKSGILGLNPITQGGFIKNSINLIAGGAGAGKTILGIQFLLQGIKNGEPGIYITFEEKKEKMYKYMKSFGFDLKKYEKQKKFHFLEYTPEQVKKMLVEGGGAIEAMIEKMKAKRIVIDSITSFTLLYEDELTKKEASLSLFELIDKWDCTALLTAQAEEKYHESITAALEFEVDSIIILYHCKKHGERIRGLEILKMRGTKHPNKVFAVKIDEKGLSVSKEKVNV